MSRARTGPRSRFSEHLTPLARPRRESSMTPEEFNETLERLKLSVNASSRLLGVNDRTARRWAIGEAPLPPPVERFLRFLVRARIKPQYVMELLS